MAPATLLHLSFLLVVSATKSWWDSVKGHVKDRAASLVDASPIHPWDIMTPEALSLRKCGGAADGMQVDEVYYDPVNRKVVVGGELMQQVLDGEVDAKIKLGRAPVGASVSEQVKRKMAFGMSAKQFMSEPLCEHQKRYHGAACPFTPGPRKMRFGFHSLPARLVAGEYHVELRVRDSDGLPLLCVNGTLSVARGPQGQLLRSLDTGLRRVNSRYCCNELNDDCTFASGLERDHCSEERSLGDCEEHHPRDDGIDNGHPNCDYSHEHDGDSIHMYSAGGASGGAMSASDAAGSFVSSLAVALMVGLLM